jgi:hypothetical protein
MTSVAIVRWVVTHRVKELRRYDPRSQIWILTAGKVTAEACTNCPSRLE